MPRKTLLLCTLACAAPVLASAPGPEPEWLLRLRAVANSAAAELNTLDTQLSEQFAAVRDDIRAELKKEAKAAAARRGLHMYRPASEQIPAVWVTVGENSELPDRIVLLVHGLDEPGGIWDDLAPVLAESGYNVLRFDYRNDDAIAASATALEEAMRTLRERGVNRVDIVAHSMGGLVSRDVLTRSSAYAGDGTGHEDLPDVHRLITLGTPNNGSVWAHLAPLGDAREHIARWMDEPSEPRRLLGFMVDGDGQAGADLLPGSEYLEELNARELPSNVRITAIVASMAEVTNEDMACLTEPGIARSVLGKEAAGAIAQGVQNAASFLGDGVVCFDSGASVCLDDVVTVRANHRTMIRNFDVVVAARRAVGAPNATPPAIPVILDRLARELSEPVSSQP